MITRFRSKHGANPLNYPFIFRAARSRKLSDTERITFLFSEIFIKNMQFMYICIRLNSLRYKLHKLHFLNFFFINKVLCMVSKFPPYKP